MKITRRLTPFSITFAVVSVATFAFFCYRDYTTIQNLQNFTHRVPYTNSVGMKMVLLPSGDFLMGTDKLGDQLPVHRVVLSSFWIAQCEVTNAQFELFKKRPRPVESLTDQQPVTRITWYEAAAYCRWLSHKEGRHYRLPTEAEWEYAARGGLVQQDYPWQDEGPLDDPTKHATFESLVTTPVGQHDPNGFGLYDMAGNVGEWVSDWYGTDYYAHSPLKDPQGPPAPRDPKYREHILRGGFFCLLEGECWKQDLWDDIVPDLSKFGKADQCDGSGFRVAMDIKP